MKIFRRFAPVTALILLSIGVLIAQDTSEKTSNSSGETVYKVGNGVKVPKPVYMPDPEFSDYARKKKIEGTVGIAFVVTAEGRVRDVRVTKSLEPSLDQQAVSAVSTWKFEPATKDGNPVAVHLNAEVSFNLAKKAQH